MRIGFPVLFIFLLIGFSVKSQYLYKDILLSRQNQDNWKLYHDHRVKAVDIQSIDANDEKTEGFACTQTVSPDFSSISTFTKSGDIPASTLTAFYDKSGRLIKTIDTSDTFKSTTEYGYNENGDVSSLLNSSLETDNNSMSTEKHIWIYEGAALKKMIKIKGETDTTFITFVRDEKGNIAEEKSLHRTQPLPSVYYYYNNDGKLTDIVRYNQKARRLLPDYIFEYNNGLLSSMVFVPNGSTDYQRWVYAYDANGFKSGETCYDKKRQVVVKIRYNYTFR